MDEARRHSDINIDSSNIDSRNSSGSSEAGQRCRSVNESLGMPQASASRAHAQPSWHIAALTRRRCTIVLPDPSAPASLCSPLDSQSSLNLSVNLSLNPATTLVGCCCSAQQRDCIHFGQSSVSSLTNFVVFSAASASNAAE
jgi:uncharacterized protein (DUF2126 family)